jgi:hypothetical protein
MDTDQFKTVLATMIFLCTSSRPDISKCISSQIKLPCNEIDLSSVLLYLRKDSVAVSVGSSADDLPLSTRYIHHPTEGNLSFESLCVRSSVNLFLQIGVKIEESTKERCFNSFLCPLNACFRMRRRGLKPKSCPRLKFSRCKRRKKESQVTWKKQRRIWKMQMNW